MRVIFASRIQSICCKFVSPARFPSISNCMLKEQKTHFMFYVNHIENKTTNYFILCIISCLPNADPTLLPATSLFFFREKYLSCVILFSHYLCPTPHPHPPLSFEKDIELSSWKFWERCVLKLGTDL